MASSNISNIFVPPPNVLWDGTTGNTNYIYGTSASETLNGTNGTDAIYGGAGSDALNGGRGNDVLNGGAGFDILDGGEGVDTVSYIDSAKAVQVQLAGTGLGSTTVTGEPGDWLINIENVWGSAFADYIVGDQFVNQLSGAGGHDMLFGYGGADMLSGGAGNDTLNGGAGADKLDGGEGSDTASYAGSTSAVYVNLTSNSQVGGDSAGDTFVSIENLEGSNYSDTLRGDANYNTLTGGDGADKLYGEGGADILMGGRGADTLSGGIGRDTFVILRGDIGTGVDVVTDFQQGFDRIDLRSFGFGDFYGDGGVTNGPTDGSVWQFGYVANYQLVFDWADDTLYSVTSAQNSDGFEYVTSRTPIVTLTGVSLLTGNDLILS